MSEFPVDSAENGDMAAVMENFQKKNAAMVSRPQVSSTSAAQVSGAGSGRGAMTHNRGNLCNVELAD
jgi:hypothetical protein